MNKLVLANVLKKRVDPVLESTCAIGVDEMSWDDLSSEHYDWPAVDTVTKYRETVRGIIDDLITSLPAPTFPINYDSPWWLILMGSEHERIHLETSSVLMRQLPLEEVCSRQIWAACEISGDALPNSLLPVPAGRVSFGKDLATDPLYSWDLETGVAIADVKEFEASKYLVSNGQWLGFMKVRRILLSLSLSFYY